MSNYSKITYNSSNFIKKFPHKKRFEYYTKSILCNYQNKNINLKLLDYGAGDGYMFVCLSKYNYGKLSLFAYEPSPGQHSDLLENLDKHNLTVSCFRKLGDDKFDIILCTEVLEHFSYKSAVIHIKKIKNILTKKGTLIISVPIEVGLSGLLKNLIRFLLNTTHEGLTLKTLIRSFFDLPIPRDNDDYIDSHIGFSFNKLEKILLESGFCIKKKYYSPFPILKRFMNSQIIFECCKE